MTVKDKDVLKSFVLFILSVAGSILFLSTRRSFYELMIGLILAFSAIGWLVKIIKLLTTKELTDEEKAAEVEKKLADVPRLETPCKVSVTRTSSFLGASNYVAVFLHDFEVGRLKNGMTLEFTTDYASNGMVLQPEVGNGIAINFPATANGHVRFEFDYRKGTITQI